MKNLLFTALILLSSCQLTQVATTGDRDPASTKLGDKFGKKAVRDYFKSVTAEERNDALARSLVFTTEYDPEKVASVDVIAATTEACGPAYQYQKGIVEVEKNDPFGHSFPSSTRYASTKWPKIECQYHADTEKSMSGGSTKFLCDFADERVKGGVQTRKVRYPSDSDDPLDSEVVETTLAFNLAKLVGLPTKSFCPAVVSCKNCPSANPWRDDRGSKGPGKKTYEFPWALIETDLPSYIISTPTTGNAPNGVEYEEVKVVKADTEEARKKMLIEREALMLWINFIQNTDAGGFNHRVGCLAYEKTPEEKYYCTKPVFLLHDHGHSFHRHFNYSAWAKIPVFQRSEKNSGCRFGLDKDSAPKRGALKGIILGAEVSAEARDFLYERLSRVTEQQWKDMYHLARAEEATKVRTEQFLKDIRKKLNEMKAANCLPFDMGKSVLFK
ncbi:MAG: hypothetical protein K0R29_811 [Pseudobdellovibrio sp.]|jgi:hypothetical protein|nr:hypothetical protein [Pseudobdellovibrio sp.]